MFQENQSHPSDLRFIDFQISRVGWPVLDFSYFFYTCAPKNLLSQVDKFLGVYYESLFYFMEELGSKPEELFSLSALKEHWRKYSHFGLIMSISLFKFMLCDDDELYSITETEFAKAFVNPIKKEDLCNRRSIDVIMHFAEYNLI